MLFYRAAFTDEVKNLDGSGSFMSNRLSVASSNRGRVDSFKSKSGKQFNLLKCPHTERKLVVGLNFPNNSKI